MGWTEQGEAPRILNTFPRLWISKPDFHPEIVKVAFGCGNGCPVISSWCVVRCFELNQTRTCPQSNSILWLLMSSYVASGNQTIFQLLTSSPFSTQPARIFYSSTSKSPQERCLPSPHHHPAPRPLPLARWFPENNPFCRTNELKSSVHYNPHNSEERQGSWCSNSGKECHGSPLRSTFLFIVFITFATSPA